MFGILAVGLAIGMSFGLSSAVGAFYGCVRHRPVESSTALRAPGMGPPPPPLLTRAPPAQTRALCAPLPPPWPRCGRHVCGASATLSAVAVLASPNAHAVPDHGGHCGPDHQRGAAGDRRAPAEAGQRGCPRARGRHLRHCPLPRRRLSHDYLLHRLCRLPHRVHHSAARAEQLLHFRRNWHSLCLLPAGERRWADPDRVFLPPHLCPLPSPCRSVCDPGGLLWRVAGARLATHRGGQSGLLPVPVPASQGGGCGLRVL